MEIIWVLLLFIIGLIMTVKGGDWFVDASIWIAERTGISSGIIAATIISVATTLPEFFVSIVASDEGFSEMAVGNALGSYICNIAFIIGICALIRPMKIKDDYFGIKGAMMLMNLFVFFVLSKNGRIDHKEGCFLMLLIVPFLIINIIEYKKIDRGKNKKQKYPINKKEAIFNALKFAIGGGLIIYGAHILVDAGVEIANILRIPKQVVSLTLLAVGTSVPELVTSVTAIVKNEENISIGNILGSNILNLSIIMGASSLISDQGLIISSQTLFLDIPIAILIASIFILTGLLKERMSRFTGILLLSIYITYLLILF